MDIIKYIPVGTKVIDDLTGKEATIVGVVFHDGKQPLINTTCVKTLGYWVDNKYLGGGRHPWEITEIKGKN